MTGFLLVFLQTSLILAFTTLLLPCNGQAYVQDAVCQPLAPEKNNRIRPSLAGSYCLKPNLEIPSRNRLLPDGAAGLPSQAVANHRDNVILDLQSRTVRAGDVSLGIRIENTGPTNYVPDHQGFAQSPFSSSNACIRLSDLHSQGWSVRVEGPGTYCLAEDLNQSAPPAWMRLPHMAVPYDPLVAVPRGAAGNITIDLAGRLLVTTMESGQGMMHLGGAAWIDGESHPQLSPARGILLRNGSIRTTVQPAVIMIHNWNGENRRFYRKAIAQNTLRGTPLTVKTRLVIDALSEQFRPFGLPILERLNWRLMLERPLWDAVIVDLDVIAQRRFQFGS